MKKEDPRDFTLAESDMLKEAQRFQAQFVENQTDFTDEYNVFKTPFETKMQDLIDVCMAATTDEICVAKVHKQTEIVDKFVSTGNFNFQKGVEYIKIAFPGSSSMLKLFGQPLYEKSRSSHTLLPVLLMQAYNMAIDPDNKDLLIAEGMTLLKIEALKTNADDINAAVQKQIKLMGARTLSTQDRTRNLNALWAMMKLLSDCSKKIYVDNPAMWNLYLLYPNTPPAPPTPPPTTPEA